MTEFQCLDWLGWRELNPLSLGPELPHQNIIGDRGIEPLASRSRTVRSADELVPGNSLVRDCASAPAPYRASLWYGDTGSLQPDACKDESLIEFTINFDWIQNFRYIIDLCPRTINYSSTLLLSWTAIAGGRAAWVCRPLKSTGAAITK